MASCVTIVAEGQALVARNTVDLLEDQGAGPPLNAPGLPDVDDSSRGRDGEESGSDGNHHPGKECGLEGWTRLVMEWKQWKLS